MFLEKYKNLFDEDNNDVFNNQLQNLKKINYSKTNSLCKNLKTEKFLNQNLFKKKKNSLINNILPNKFIRNRSLNNQQTFKKNFSLKENENKFIFNKSKNQKSFLDTLDKIKPNYNFGKLFFNNNEDVKENLIKEKKDFFRKQSKNIEFGLDKDIIPKIYRKNYESDIFFLKNKQENKDKIEIVKEKIKYKKEEKDKFIGKNTSLLFPSEKNIKDKIKEEFPLNLIYGNFSGFRSFMNDYEKERKIKTISESILNPQKYFSFLERNCLNAKQLYQFEKLIKKRIKAKLNVQRKIRLKNILKENY